MVIQQEKRFSKKQMHRVLSVLVHHSFALTQALAKAQKWKIRKKMQILPNFSLFGAKI